MNILTLFMMSAMGISAANTKIFEDKKFLTFAHRGGAAVVPENTLVAFDHAVKVGMDVIELDVHATKDGVLVVSHDPTVDRVTNGSGKISGMTLEELQKLDAGYKFHSYQGKGIVVPTLKDVFLAYPEMKFNIEPKQFSPPITKDLCQLLREMKMTDKVIVSSFKHEVIAEFRTLCPEVATGATSKEAIKFLILQRLGLGNFYRPVMQALQLPLKMHGLTVITKNLVRAAHKLNLKVHVWTINDKEEMKSLIEMGVDGIMTDYPEELMKLVHSQN